MVEWPEEKLPGGSVLHRVAPVSELCGRPAFVCLLCVHAHVREHKPKPRSVWDSGSLLCEDGRLIHIIVTRTFSWCLGCPEWWEPTAQGSEGLRRTWASGPSAEK